MAPCHHSAGGAHVICRLPVASLRGVVRAVGVIHSQASTMAAGCRARRSVGVSSLTALPRPIIIARPKQTRQSIDGAPEFKLNIRCTFDGSELSKPFRPAHFLQHFKVCHCTTSRIRINGFRADSGSFDPVHDSCDCWPSARLFPHTDTKSPSSMTWRLVKLSRRHCARRFAVRRGSHMVSFRVSGSGIQCVGALPRSVNGHRACCRQQPSNQNHRGCLST